MKIVFLIFIFMMNYLHKIFTLRAKSENLKLGHTFEGFSNFVEGLFKKGKANNNKMSDEISSTNPGLLEVSSSTSSINKKGDNLFARKTNLRKKSKEEDLLPIKLLESSRAIQF